MGVILVILTALLGLSADGYETIPGYTGENVTLSCPHCSSNTLSFIRLKRHGSEYFISYCRDGHPMIPKDRDPSFVGRVEGMKCPMEGDIISVTVTNLTRDDTGGYEWAWKNSTGAFDYKVDLNVTDLDAGDGGNGSGDDVNRNTTSRKSMDAGVIAGGAAAAAAGIIVIIIVYLHRSRFKRRTVPCKEADQQDSDLELTERLTSIRSKQSV